MWLIWQVKFLSCLPFQSILEIISLGILADHNSYFNEKSILKILPVGILADDNYCFNENWNRILQIT